MERAIGGWLVGGWWLVVGGGWVVVGGGWLLLVADWWLQGVSDQRHSGDPRAPGRRRGVHPTPSRAPSAAPATQITAAQQGDPRARQGVLPARQKKRRRLFPPFGQKGARFPRKVFHDLAHFSILVHLTST